MQGTTFKSELKRIFDSMDCLSDKKYIGRNFYGNINNDLRLRAYFGCFNKENDNAILKTEIISWEKGIIDKNDFHFNEFWMENENAVLREESNGTVYWKPQCPTDTEIKILSDELNALVSVYGDQSISKFPVEQTENEAEDDEEMDI